jgi:hypothetical protein
MSLRSGIKRRDRTRMTKIFVIRHASVKFKMQLIGLAYLQVLQNT